MSIFKKVLDVFKEDTPLPKSKEDENREIISIYHQIKRVAPDYDEPNYTLAEKVFREFNDLNLRNINEIPHYGRYIPKSLLPYPKNYIKCAYYIFLEDAKRHNDEKISKLIQEVGTSLFFDYPDYATYKANKAKEADDVFLKMTSPHPRESFKKIYGAYEISEEDYNSSPSSVGSTNEKLIHDFGVLPEIEDDVDYVERMKKIMNQYYEIK